jgi:hypothetical protein
VVEDLRREVSPDGVKFSKQRRQQRCFPIRSDVFLIRKQGGVCLRRNQLVSNELTLDLNRKDYVKGCLLSHSQGLEAFAKVRRPLDW